MINLEFNMLKSILFNKQGLTVLPLVLLIFVSNKALSQALPQPGAKADTVVLTIGEAEKQFLDRNLTLLAQKYQVEATKSLIIQAKLYTNPNISGSVLIKNNNYPDAKAPDGSTIKANHKYFDLTRTGEQSFQVSQLIAIAGKRRNAIKVAKMNSTMAEDQFYDLIRTLKSQLRTDFYSIYFNQQSQGVYSQEIDALTKTSAAYTQLLAKGFIAKKEALRIQAQLFALENELIALSNQITQSEADLNILLAGNGVYYVIKADTARLNKLTVTSLSLPALNDSALANRYDLKVAAANLESSKYSLRLQHSLSVPDPIVGYNFDRNGSYVPNSRLLTLGIDLPLFNRNQGNIRNARFNIKNNEAQFMNQQKVVQGDVYKAYNSALLNEKMARSFDPSFARNYSVLVQEVLKNYQKRNIGLLEFLDYYDSFKQNVLQSNSLQLNRIAAYELINFAVGKDIFN